MKVHYLKAGDEVLMKDLLMPDMIYVHKTPAEMSLKIQMSKYEGGMANQTTSSLYLEQGQFID
jgi:hypothetical protein